MDALAQLEWGRVLSASGGAPFLRALVEDLSDALGIAPDVPGWPPIPTSPAATSRASAPRNPVLRNL